MTDEEATVVAAPRKKAGGRGRSRAVVATTTADSGTEDQVPPVQWFGRKQKVSGRPCVLFNDATDETDIMSLAVYSGIRTDEQLAGLVGDNDFLSELAEIAAVGLAHKSKTAPPEAVNLVTRYYTELPEEVSTDVRIAYKPSVDGKTPRWAVNVYFVPLVCSILDGGLKKHRLLMSSVVSKTVSQILQSEGPSMVTLRGQRRDLFTLPMDEIESLEQEALTLLHPASLLKELLGIRKLFHTNCEKGISVLCRRMSDADDQIRAEQMLRESQVATVRTEFEREMSTHRLQLADQQCINDSTREQCSLQVEESSRRLDVMNSYGDGVLSIFTVRFRQFSTLKSRQVIGTAGATTGGETLSSGTESVIRQLEDARLEIERLKNCARAKAVPKPKLHRKAKDPDLYLATELEIKRSVREHVVKHGVITTGRKAVMISNTPPMSSGMIFEDVEIEAARKLKALSRSREKDLCEAESGSEQLADVVESLSSLLTSVALTIEDVAARRTAILNHMRSLAMHSRSITGIIRERPYLLPLARRMNHERKPLVKLDSLRALVNVATGNLSQLREIENITLDSVGGSFEVMSLEEAAEEAWNITTESCTESLTVAAAFPPPHPLTRATLRRHSAAAESSNLLTSGDDE